MHSLSMDHTIQNNPWQASHSGMVNIRMALCICIQPTRITTRNLLSWREQRNIVVLALCSYYQTVGHHVLTERATL